MISRTVAVSNTTYLMLLKRKTELIERGKQDITFSDIIKEALSK